MTDNRLVELGRELNVDEIIEIFDRLDNNNFISHDDRWVLSEYREVLIELANLLGNKNNND